ncbi:MAG: hypothetical protein GXY76_19330 [Chloroflexi bacterium]|nr:hypothetical protein [Chloroflexota bacterium]
MATTEERLQILRMIQAGKISAEEGEKLIEALRAKGQRMEEDSAAPSRWLRIRVSDARSGKNKVNVNLPMRLVDMALKTAIRFIPDLEAEDLEALRVTLRSGAQGKVLDVDQDENDEHIEIFVE